jgi:hypothetical protein
MRGRYGALGCIIGPTLRRAGVSTEDLERAHGEGIRDAFSGASLPVTLGAVAVLHQAQHSHDRGRNRVDVLADVAKAASTLLQLVPQALVDEVARSSPLAHLDQHRTERMEPSGTTRQPHA